MTHLNSYNTLLKFKLGKNLYHKCQGSHLVILEYAYQINQIKSNLIVSVGCIARLHSSDN